VYLAPRPRVFTSFRPSKYPTTRVRDCQAARMFGVSLLRRLTAHGCFRDGVFRLLCKNLSTACRTKAEIGAAIASTSFPALAVAFGEPNNSSLHVSIVPYSSLGIDRHFVLCDSSRKYSPKSSIPVLSAQRAVRARQTIDVTSCL